MFKKLPVFKITPIESDLLEIAIVDDPAIEQYFLKFSEEPIKIQFNSDKQILTGPVMIPNQLIYRNDVNGERFVTYDEEGIKLAASMFFKNGLRFNESHTDKNVPIEILESYFTAENNTFGIPAGSWIVSAKVKDLELWDRIKDNEFNGFSFQSLFSNELVGIEELKFNKEKMKELGEKLQAAINAVLFSKETPEETAVVEVEPKVEVVETFSKEMFEQAINAATKVLMDGFEEKLNSMKVELEQKQNEFNTKLEEFAKQPLSAPVTEQVEGTIKGTNPALAYLTGLND